ADAPQLDGVVLASVRGVRLREVRQRDQHLVPAALDLPKLRLVGGERLAEPARLVLELRRGGAGALRGADLLREPPAARAPPPPPPPQRPRPLRQRDQLAKAAAGAPPRQRRAHSLRLGPYGPQVEQRCGLRLRGVRGGLAEGVLHRGQVVA